MAGDDRPQTLANWLSTDAFTDEVEAADRTPDLPRLVLATDAPADLIQGSLLGKGGMAEVWRAEQTALGRSVAVKRARKKGDVGRTRALLREAWITGQLEHPNIVPVHMVGETEDYEPLVVLRAIEGEAWDAALRTRRGEEALDDHLGVFVAVCNAVHYAHEQGFVHRDIKPANVQLGAFGEVYLLDWGIAETLDKTVVLPAGTPAYMAPEMTRPGPPDRRSDVFLLGATLLTVLTGTPPRDKESISKIIAGEGDGTPEIVYPKGLPAGIEPILRKACATDPRDRFRTALRFRDAVVEWQRDRSIEALLSAAQTRLRRFLLAVRLGAENPEDESAALAARERFSAVRFGFEQVLSERPEHLEAKQGLQSALEAMLRLELRLGQVAAAKTLLLALDAPPEDLVSELERAAADHDQRREEQARLAKLAAGYDTRDVARDWGLLIATVVLVTAVSIFISNGLFGLAERGSLTRSLMLVLPGAFAMASVAAWRRQTLLFHPVGRKLTSAAFGLAGVLLANRLSSALARIDLSQAVQTESFVIAAWLFGASMFMTRHLYIALFAVLGGVAVRLMPSHGLAVSTHNVVVITTFALVGYLWWHELQQRAES